MPIPGGRLLEWITYLPNHALSRKLKMTPAPEGALIVVYNIVLRAFLQFLSRNEAEKQVLRADHDTTWIPAIITLTP
jgi:hypothetical protein